MTSPLMGVGVDECIGGGPGGVSCEVWLISEEQTRSAGICRNSRRVEIWCKSEWALDKEVSRISC